MSARTAFSGVLGVGATLGRLSTARPLAATGRTH
jgi:hypothetical protein